MYQGYPGKLWQMSKTWRPAGYDLGCQEMLGEPEGNLDAGFTLPLRRRALAQGSFADAVTYLAGPEAQAEIDMVL
eukprot:987159-Pyramimonas_sp.AAC.1